MSPAGHGTKNDCAGEASSNLPYPTDREAIPTPLPLLLYPRDREIPAGPVIHVKIGRSLLIKTINFI
jgi:hypothetical protein